jgi:O-antigen/teichoic acid export membrane protein
MVKVGVARHARDREMRYPSGGKIATKSEPTAASAPDGAPELRSAARGGAATLAGSSVSAAMGFVLSLVLARSLGAVGSGVVLQSIAVFTIALSLARLGMDTTAVWILPRVRTDDPRDTRAVLATLLLWTTAASGGAALLLVAGALLLDTGDTASRTAVVHAVLVVAPFLPFGAVMMVALAATRGFGGVLPFNLIGNVAVPVVRPVAVLVVVVSGGSAVLAALAWAAPLVPAALVSLWVVTRQVRRFETRRDVAGTWRPNRSVNRRVLGFALPRTLASGLEQSIIWLDVILVGIIAGAGASGVYGAASRFVAAGVIVSTALRIVVAPRFSALLARGALPEVQDLYTVTSRWIILFGAPIYILLAWFAPSVLSWLGPGFGSGVSSMVVLCLGSLVVLAAGNVQSLLLMSGRSGWGAVNKLIVVAFNVVGNCLLVPQIGILGAAITWALSMSLDTGLAVFQVRRFTGVSPRIGPIMGTVAVAATCASVPAAGLILGRGNDSLAFVLAVAAAGALLLLYCFLDRRRLRLDVLFAARG